MLHAATLLLAVAVPSRPGARLPRPAARISADIAPGGGCRCRARDDANRGPHHAESCALHSDGARHR